MEATQQLRTEGLYPPQVSPVDVAMHTGDQINQILATYGQRKYETQAATIAAARQERLQQLRLDAVAKNVAARDAMFLAREAEASHSREQVALTAEHARADAVTANAANASLKAEQDKAAKYGTQEPAWKGTGPNGSITAQDVVQHSNDWAKANAAQRDNLINMTAARQVALMHEQDDQKDEAAGYTQKYMGQAMGLAAAKYPFDGWSQTLPQNDPKVVAYNSAVGQVGSRAAATSSGLLPAYQAYIKQIAPGMAADLLKINESSDPVAKDLLARITKNSILQQTALQDKKGQPVDYAPEVRQKAMLDYVNDHAANVKSVHDQVIQNGGQPTDPSVIAAATDAKSKIQSTQQFQQQIGAEGECPKGGAGRSGTETAARPSESVVER